MQEELIKAASRLRGKGFLNRPGDAVSMLMVGEGKMLILGVGGMPRAMSISTPEPGVATLHAQVYRTRPDAGAVATLSPRWSLQLKGLGEAMPGIFDEQARHLGRGWVPTRAADLPAALSAGGNAGLVDDCLLVLGITRNRLLFNAELFEKCAMAYVLARLGGGKVKRLPWIVRKVAGGRLLKDEATASAAHAQGLRSPEPSGY